MIPSACPVCGGEGSPTYQAVDQNRGCSAIEFIYSTCRRCGTVFLTNVPKDLDRYYEAEYYAIPTFERLTEIARGNSTKIDIVRRFKTNGRLLEIGPAFGVFACQAKMAGFDVDVIEMDERCCRFLEEEVAVGVTRSDQPEVAITRLPEHDVIAMWHVLEHVPHASTMIEAAASNLGPGGILVIATPNPQSFQFRVMGRNWPHLDAPRHLALIPPEALADLGRRHGLEMVLVTTDDREARHWNWFGWQWLLRNRVNAKLAKQIAHAVGTLLGILMSPFDRRLGQGSAYTMVLRKTEV